MNWKVTFTIFFALTCFLATSQNFPMTAALTNINSCTGFFMDSGGNTGNYGANQNFTTVICPGTTGGTHVQLNFSAPLILPGDELCFFDGPTTAAPALSCVSDFAPGASFIIQATAANPSGCITVTFNSNGSLQALGWSAAISCITSCQTILSVLDNTDPLVEPADTGWIDICPNDRVFFWGKGEYPQNGVLYQHSDLTSNFEWDFGDGDITYGPNVSHVYEEPGGYVVQLTITDQNGCRNTNYISQRVRVAPRPHFEIGDYVDQICSGDTVQLNSMIDSMDNEHTVSVMPAEAGFQAGAIRSDSLPLPDGDGTSYLTSISFTDFSPGQLLTNINDLLSICVNMEHSWMRDLKIEITCPNGQSALLHNHPGQIGGEVFLGVPYENDEGFAVPVPGIGFDYGWSPNPDFNNTWISYANTFAPQTLPSGLYNSFESLDSLLGCPLNGEWTIKVTDLWAIDNGYIFSWGIKFDPSLYPNIETFSPDILTWEWNDHPSIFVTTGDSIAGSPINAGEVAYTFTVHDEFGCAWDTTVNINVLPFTHPLCHACLDNLTPQADTTVCQGEPVALDAAATINPDTTVTFESYDDYPIGAGNHPNSNLYNSVISVNSISPLTLTNAAAGIVSVCVDLETDFDADISLFLRAPNNQVLLLSNGNGGSGDNYKNTCFTPTAATPITAGTAPFTGNFQPEGVWSVFNGTPINGDWTLRVSDAAGINAYGRLVSWSITFRSENDVTYTWTPAAGLSCTNCPNPTATPTNSTNYIVTANDSYGCQAKDTIIISVLNSFTAPVVNCSPQIGGQVLINWNDVSPGLTYEVNINGTGWVASNNGNLSHLVSGLNNGDDVNIQVRVNVNGAACQVGVGTSFCSYMLCPIVASLTNPGPFAVSCAGLCDESVSVDVTDGMMPYIFTINNLTANTSNVQNTSPLTDLCPGSYQVIVEDADHCIDTVAFVVGEPAPIVVTAVEVSPVNCSGGNDGCASVTATGGAGGVTFVWDNANMSTAANICNLMAGPVSVMATDGNGCQQSASVTITELPPVVLTIVHTDVKCKGGNNGSATVTATGGSGNYTYQWSSGTTPTQMTTNGLTQGIFSVTVEDGNGCQAFENVQISEPANGVTVMADQTFTSCFQENQSEATATPVGGSGNYTYLWTPSGQTTATATGLSPTDYTVVVTDGNGCTISDQVTITEWDDIFISISLVPPTCHGLADGEMAANIVAGGNGTYTFAWSNGPTSDFIDNLPGDVTYTVTVSDTQGCSGVLSRLLQDPPAITASVQGNDAKCHNTTDGSATVDNVQNAQGALTYQWSLAAMNQTTVMANDLAPGSYSVTLTDAAGCTGSASGQVGAPTAITANFKAVDNECFGNNKGSIELTAAGGAGGFTYLWSNGATTSMLSNLNAGPFYVSITDGNGCVHVDSSRVAEPLRVSTDITAKDVSCFGDKNGSISVKITEGGTPPFLYSLDGDIFFGSSTLIALKAADYPVYVKDANGCVYAFSATVGEPPLMTLDILSNSLDLEEVTINLGEEVSLDASVNNGVGVVTFAWDASYCGSLFCDTVSDCDTTLTCETATSRPEYTNDYFLTAVDENGCKAEDHVQIHVHKDRRVVVPTGFTPNSDGNNDLLVVHGKSGTMVKLYQVFDRWGELLFQDIDVPINSLGRGWDGSFKGKDMMPGVYVWYIEVEYEDGMTDSFKGETTLIR